MAAGQTKKRLASSHLGEQGRGKKKKKQDSSDYILNLKSHVHLEWDDRQKRAVPKREQIAITWMDLAPFVDSSPRPKSGLADVLSVPRVIFDLETLKEVLSHEVWATCLSESERKFLTQFLPSGTSAEEAVQSLLSGKDEHRFGNPFLKWSSSLISGKLHPDKAVRVERQLKSNKKAYYSELYKYHIGMVETLKKWKEIWTDSEDPEQLRKAFTKPIPCGVSDSLEKTKIDSVSKKELPSKLSVQYDDGAKYMSYIKISKQQHEKIKSMKHSSDGIHCKSLSRVLGDIKMLNIQPYKAFEEEEKIKLHGHWIHLVNNEVPEAFESFRQRKIHKGQSIKSLEQELAEKMKLVNNKDMILLDYERSYQESLEDSSVNNSITDMLDEEDRSINNTSNDHQLERIPSLNRCQDFITRSSQEVSDQSVLQPTENYFARNTSQVKNAMSQEVVGGEIVDQDLLRSSGSFYGRTGGDAMVQEEDGRHMLKSANGFFGKTNPSENIMELNAPALVHEEDGRHMLKSANGFFGKTNPSESIMELNAPVAVSKDLWQAIGTRGSQCNSSSENRGFSSGNLSLRQLPAAKEKHSLVIDLETDLPQCQNVESVSLSLNTENGATLFGPYTNQERAELLLSYSKGPEMLNSYPHGLNGMMQSSLSFFSGNDSLVGLGTGQFLNPFQNQHRLFEQKQLIREKDLYMHRMVNENMHSSGRYPRQDNIDQQQGLMAMHSSCVAGAGTGSHNMLSNECQIPNGWLQSSHQLPNRGHHVGDGNATDGSLFSVFSECKVMQQQHTPYNMLGSEQFMQARAFVPTGENIYSYPTAQMKASNNHDGVSAASSITANNISWMNMHQQTPGLQDLAGKQYQRHWN